MTLPSTTYITKIPYALLLLFCLLCPKAWAQALPPITNYAPSMYGGDNQNWQASQDDEGIIYFANNKGLLSFNGAQWDLNPSPNETIIRSVKAIGDHIYTGAHMDFGYWKKRLDGTLQYTSIKDSLNVQMLEGEQIWKILPYKDKILLQSLNGIYVYSPTTGAIDYLFIDIKNTIYRLFNIDEELFFQVNDKGLYTIKDGEVALYDDRQLFKQLTFTSIFKRGDGWLGVSQKNGIYRITASSIVPWKHSASATLSDKTVYRSAQLSDGSIALGTIAHGFIKLTRDGAVDNQFTQSNGLGNNTVLSIFEDSSQNVWTGLDNGIACINMNTPIRIFFDQKGRLGTTYVSVLHKGSLYLGTNQGLFYKAQDSKEFVLIPGTEEQVWTLQVIDDTLFCGHNRGTFVITDGTQEQIGTINGTWNIRTIPNHPNLLLQGNYDGLYILEKTNNSWSVRNKIEGFDISSRYFEFIGDQNILVSNEYKGVYEVQIDAAFAKAEKQTLNSSVNKGEHSSLAKFAGTTFYANKEGIYTYNASASAFEKENEASKVYENTFISGRLVNDGFGKLWAFTKSGLVYFSEDALTSELAMTHVPIPHSLTNTVKGFENIAPFTEDTFIIGTTNGYLTINPDLPIKKYSISINQIKKKERDESYGRIPLNDEEAYFSWKENTVAFSYHVSQYSKFQQTQYQHRLKGFYNSWSEWSTAASQEFANIPPGEYTFEARARVGGVILDQPATYTFTIGKPWYASYVAITLYILLGVLLLLSINSSNKKRYRKKQEKLLEQAQIEMDLKSLAVEKENIELRNQNLKSDIEARNRELAASTMAMVSKSKTLNSIKEKLSKLETSREIQSVIKEIDRNISTKEDWNFFEKAFNHADKDFFKKVKEKHSTLTTNDLKLCVYLRLNMSSKEIAPLLNISYRSVEIKRYRLRKKIGLTRDIQLNEYFMNL